MKNIINKIIRIAGTVLAFFNLLMFYALRPCWSGISSTLGYKGGANTILYNLPLIICIVIFAVLLADLILKKIFKDKNWINIAFLVVSLVFFIAIMVIIALGAIDYMRFVWPKFFLSAGVLVVVFVFYFFIFIYPKIKVVDNPFFKYGALSLVSVIAVAYLVHFSFNRITQNPVVYAVEDKYQIVFSTSAEATAWAEVGDEKYYDLYNGSMTKFSKIHKIEVPMAALDSAKKYTVHTRQSIYCGPFGGYLGEDISITTNFKPVDSSDGLQYLSFSDVHMNDWQTAKTASHVKDYDFLFLLGDLISDVETFDDANFNNKVAYEITKGEIPVVYARGNHDVKGRYGEELHKFVGAKGDSFFYNFYFDDVYGIVLDIGEDHDDDWWEYYDTSRYDVYREEQLDFLRDEIAKGEFNSYKYHVAACHIPIPFVNYRHNHEYVKKEMTALLNQMDLDMFVCGHQHQLMIFEPGLIEPNTELTYNSNYKSGKYKGYLTDFNFPSFMVSKQGFTFGDPTTIYSAKSHIGFYVDVDFVNNKEVCHYLNSNGEKVEVMNMFYEKDYGTEITIDLTTKAFIG